MTLLEEKGLKVGDYCINKFSFVRKLSKILKDDGTGLVEVTEIVTGRSYKWITHHLYPLTDEQQAMVLLGIDPITGQPL